MSLMNDPTLAAIEKAKENRRNKNPKTPKTPKEVAETKEISEPLKNLEVTYKKWNGKTKKKFKKLFEFVQDPSEVDIAEIMNILVYDHVVTKDDVVLTDAEQLNALHELYLLSISDRISNTLECVECGKRNKKTTKLSQKKFIPASPELDKGIEVLNLVITRPTIKLSEDTHEMFRVTPDEYTSKRDIDDALWFGDDVTKTIETLDDMSIKEIQQVFAEKTKSQGSFEFTTEVTCSNKECKSKTTHDIDVTSEVLRLLSE